MFYQNTQGLWTPMDTTIRNLGVEGFGSIGVPVRLFKDGKVKFVRESGVEIYSQITKRVGVFNQSTKEIVGTKDIPIGTIAGNKIVQETEIYKHEVELRESGVAEYLTLLEKPKFIKDNPNLWFVLDTTITGKEFDDGLVEEFDSDVMNFPLPTSVDGLDVDIETKRFAKKIDGKQHLFTGIRFSDLYNAVYPVVIDPDFTASTADGRYYGRSANYNYIKINCTGGSRTGTYGQLGQRYISGNYYIYRCFLKFNTSSIGAGATVTEVKMKASSEVNYATNHEFNCQIRKCDWSSREPLGVSDVTYNLAKSASFDANWCYTGSYGAHINTITSPALTNSWVEVEGSTYYSMTSSDDSIRVPTGNEYFSVCFQEHATTARRPVLQVTYTLPKSGQIIIWS